LKRFPRLKEALGTGLIYKTQWNFQAKTHLQGGKNRLFQRNREQNFTLVNNLQGLLEVFRFRTAIVCGWEKPLEAIGLPTRDQFPLNPL
jgi:hypothetical protein